MRIIIFIEQANINGEMKMTITKQTVEIAAKEMNLSVLEAITQMQAGAAITNNNKALEDLCAIKAEIIEEMF
jgi:hypothetical protein